MKKDNPFAGKKVTILGLGLLGGALNDAIFLAKHGAELTITDLKSAAELKPSPDKLKTYKGIKFVLGEHRLEDFSTADFILQPGNVPLNSPYLAEARKNNIPIHVSESLFFQYLPSGVKTIGVTGTRGKSTTAKLIFDILNSEGRSFRSAECRKDRPSVFLAGNTKGVSTLALLDNVKKGDYIVMELDSWALHGLGEVRKSPNIAVFTNLMVDHQNFYGSMDKYFADKAQIFLNQNAGDELVCGSEVLKLIQKKYKTVSARTIVPDAGVLPKSWKVKILGEHNRQNIAYAVTVARILDVPEKTIKKAVEAFTPVSGRLELVAEKRGIRYYNDTTATTPEACLEALKALRGGLKEGAGIVLISGGTDKMLDFKQFTREIVKSAKSLILFKGSATDKIVQQLKVKSEKLKVGEEFVIPNSGPRIREDKLRRRIQAVLVDNMTDAVRWARKYAVKGDIILLSPGAASFGIFKDEFDRGEQFNKIVDSI